MTTQCSICETKISGGLDTYGRPPRCAGCYFEPKPEDEFDDRVRHLRKEYISKLGQVSTCKICKGTGRSGNHERDCWRCHGQKYMRAIICNECDGHGEKAHECECELCYADHEACHCDRGIDYESYSPRVDEIAENIKEFWVTA